MASSLDLRSLMILLSVCLFTLTQPAPVYSSHISTWTSNRHLLPNMSEKELLTSASKNAPPLCISVNGPPLTQWADMYLVSSKFRGLNPSASPSPTKLHLYLICPPHPRWVSSSHPVPHITCFILTPELLYLKSLLERYYFLWKAFLTTQLTPDHLFTFHHSQSLILQSALFSSEYLSLTKIKFITNQKYLI